jgi:uncharacterized protein
MQSSRPQYTVIAKPIGPICNLACRYCYYLEKKQLYEKKESFRMSPQVLEAFIKQYIESQDTPEVQFPWQGGEPTLLGIDFFQDVVRLQKKYASGKKMTNTIQTNGILLDDRWCSFFTENQFLIGLSIDGPREFHDRYRVDHRQHPTFDKVMRGLEFLKKHNTQFNTLTVVNETNSRYPLGVYRFLKEVGDGFMQFIPLVERKPDKKAKQLGLELSLPPVPREKDHASPVNPWSVKPKQFGEFYVQIFDEWIRQDVGKYFVQFFDVALGNWMGVGSGVCHFAPKCGHAGALEHNGDLYACDHYVYPRYKLGNILDQSITDVMTSPEQHKFGSDKFDALPKYCLECEVLFACNGECPKHRFIRTPDGEPSLNYLCPAYKRIFQHMDTYMRIMAELVRSGREASYVTEVIAEQDKEKQWRTIKRNDPCPCGSGRKYKKCCDRSGEEPRFSPLNPRGEEGTH